MLNWVLCWSRSHSWWPWLVVARARLRWASCTFSLPTVLSPGPPACHWRLQTTQKQKLMACMEHNLAMAWACSMLQSRSATGLAPVQEDASLGATTEQTSTNGPSLQTAETKESPGFLVDCSLNIASLMKSQSCTKVYQCVPYMTAMTINACQLLHPFQ